VEGNGVAGERGGQGGVEVLRTGPRGSLLQGPANTIAVVHNQSLSKHALETLETLELLKLLKLLLALDAS